MKEYVVGIITDKFDYVVFVRKNRPEWQAGRLNGVGGHIEQGESPYEAMIRECREECGLELYNWLLLGTITDNTKYKVYYFSADADNVIHVETLTDEKVEIYHLDYLNYTEVIPPTDVFLRLALKPRYKFMELTER